MKLKFSILLFVVLSLATFASAGTITLDFGTFPVNNQNGTYNGFGPATTGSASIIDLICDDFTHTTYVPSQGPINYTTSTINGGLGSTEFGTGALYQYEVAAVLLYGSTDLGDGSLVGAQNAPTPAGAGNGNIAAYQYALWDLFEPNAVSGGISDSSFENSSALLATAEYDVTQDASLEGLAFSGLTIYTPNDPTGYNNYGTVPQEFLSVTLSQAPEPSSYAFLGLGLFGIVYAYQRKRRVTQ